MAPMNLVKPFIILAVITGILLEKINLNAGGKK